MLLARVDRLPQDVRKLAQEAAVIGPRFDVACSKRCRRRTGQTRTQRSNSCATQKLWRKSAGPGSLSGQSYRFTQTLLQDVIYQNLLLQRRTEMHGAIGSALERSLGENPELLEDLVSLGHHFSLSAAQTKGARYLTAAGDRARMIYANDDALRLYQQALAALSADHGSGEGTAPAWRDALPIFAAAPDGAAPHKNTTKPFFMPSAQLEITLPRRGYFASWAGSSGTPASEKGGGELCRSGGVVGRNGRAPVEQAHLLQERGRLAFRLGDHAAAVHYAEEALGHARSASVEGDERWPRKPQAQ